MRAHARGALRASEQLRDLAIGELLEATHHEHVALVGREPRERALQQVMPVVERRRARPRRYVVAKCRFSASSREAPVLDGGVVRDAIQPAAKSGARVEGPPVFENTQEDSLREIVGGVSAAGEPKAQGVRANMVAREEDAELLEVTLLHGGHQLLVGTGA